MPLGRSPAFEVTAQLAAHLPRCNLSDHALRHVPGIQHIVQAQAPDVGMCANALHTRQVGGFAPRELDISHSIDREQV